MTRPVAGQSCWLAHCAGTQAGREAVGRGGRGGEGWERSKKTWRCLVEGTRQSRARQGRAESAITSSPRGGRQN